MQRIKRHTTKKYGHQWAMLALALVEMTSFIFLPSQKIYRASLFRGLIVNVVVSYNFLSSM
jgi:hypothetical protein